MVANLSPPLAKDAVCSPGPVVLLQVDEPGIFTTHQRASSAYRRQMATRHGGIAITYVDRNIGCAYVMTWAGGGDGAPNGPPEEGRGLVCFGLGVETEWEVF